MLNSIHRMLMAADELRPSLWIGVLLLLVLLLLIPPNGVLNDNEEHYFALAHQTVSPDARLSNGTITEGMPHTFVFAYVAGTMIDVLGYEGTQIAGRVIVALLYSVALATLAGVLELGALAALAAVLVFWFSGQQLLGGEWLFFGFEPKTIAYPFVILALASVLRDQLWRAYVFLAIATYMHFLAGGFWALLFAAALLMQRVSLRRVLAALGLYALGVSALFVHLLARGYGRVAVTATADPAAAPSASTIITQFRSPHHATPFLSLTDFAEWLPGICMLFVITGLCLFIVGREQGKTRLLALVVALTGVYLIAALAVTAFDQQGQLGPLALFRPSSLMLLTAILLGIVMLTRVTGSAAQSLRIAAAVLIAAMAVPAAAVDAAQPVRSRRALDAAEKPLLDYARATPAGDTVFLIEPRLEREMLSFERRTGRPLLVLDKFVPSTEQRILEWYRRRQFQDALFSRGCRDFSYRVTHLIVSRSVAGTLAPSCGPIVFEHGSYAIIRTELRQRSTHD